MSKFSLNTLGKLLADKSGLSQVEAELFIRKMFDVCNQGLDADKQVKIKWLGTFKVQATKDRESINVNTGERFTIEGRDKLTFTPDNILKEIVNKPFAQFETVVVNDGVDFDEIDEKFGEEQTEDAPEQVIDFLDEEKTATPNPEVVVIGSEKEKEKEDEDELAKQIAIEQAKLEKLKQAQLEQERIQKEKLEKEKQEQERLEQERLEQERLEQERLEQERLEQERLEQERLEQEKLELAQQQQALKAVVEPAVCTVGKGHARPDDKLWVVYMEFLHRLAVATFALHRIIDIIGTIQISNAASTETYEMFSNEIRVVIVVHHHLGHIVQSVWYAVVEDNGHASGCQTAININVLPVAVKTDNQTVHHKLLHHLQTLTLTQRTLIRLGYHHLLIVLIEHALNARHHL